MALAERRGAATAVAGAAKPPMPWSATATGGASPRALSGAPRRRPAPPPPPAHLAVRALPQHLPPLVARLYRPAPPELAVHRAALGQLDLPLVGQLDAPPSVLALPPVALLARHAGWLAGRPPRRRGAGAGAGGGVRAASSRQLLERVCVGGGVRGGGNKRAGERGRAV